MKRIGGGALALIVATLGCTAAESEIDEYINSIEPLAVADSVIIEGEKGAPVPSGDYSCSTQDMSETRQYDEIVAFAANSDTLWPGAILRGDSIYDGLFTQVVFDRQPLKVSVSLENLAGKRSAEMAEPSLSSFREALGEILSADVTGDTAANIFAEVEEVHTEKQLSLALGASASWAGVASVSANFNFKNGDIRSRYVVKYVQSYYTVDVDQPGNPSDFFSAKVSVDEVKDKFAPGNPPVFVSSITYGRMVLFTFESSYSAFELGSALDFVYKGGADIGGNVSVSYEDMISQSNITAYILGGSGGDAAKVIDGYDALKEFIKEGGNYSRESPGAPIAYKLSYLRDNAPARLSFTDDYQITECARVSQKIKVTLDSITVEAADDGVINDKELELYGTITVKGDDDKTLFDQPSSATVKIKEGQAQTFNKEEVIQVTPQPGNNVVVTIALKENDPIGDDTFPVEVTTAAFETGWRRTMDIAVIDGGSKLKVRVVLEPI